MAGRARACACAAEGTFGAGGEYELATEVGRVDALLARPLDAVLPEAERAREDAEVVEELDTLRAVGSGSARASAERAAAAARAGALEMEGGKSGAGAPSAFSAGTTFSFARADIGRLSRLSI